MVQREHGEQTASRPLVVTEDPALLEDLLRLAAAAEVEVDVASSLARAGHRWDSCSLVVIGADIASRLDAQPRRPGVVLVCTREPDVELWRLAVDLGAEHVVVLPDGEQWLVEQFGDSATSTGSPAVVVAVMGGRGGAGASVMATGLALCASQRGIRTLLLDADPLAGGIDLILGAEDAPGVRWPELSGARGRLAPTTLDEALVFYDGLSVLSWDRTDEVEISGEAIRSVLDAGSRAYDLVVVDLPRRIDETTRDVLTRASMTYLVSPAEVRATASVVKTAAAIRPYARELRLVVRGPGPGGLEASDFADAVGLPLAVELVSERRIVQALERGDPPNVRGRTPMARACLALLRDAGVEGSASAA